MNPWMFMGVKPGDSEADLARAFRNRMFEFHPDRGGDETKAAQLSRLYDSFKKLLEDDGHGTKRLRAPVPRVRYHTSPVSWQVVVVQGPGVSVSFGYQPETGTGSYTRTGSL